MGKTWSISCQQWVLNSVYEILFSGLSVVRVMERVVKTLFSANTSHLHSVCFWWCFEGCGGGFSANTSNIHSLCFWWCCEGDGAVERVVKPHFQATPPTFTLSVVDDVVRVTEQRSMLFNLIFRQHLPPSLSLLLMMLWGWRSSRACCYNLIFR